MRQRLIPSLVLLFALLVPAGQANAAISPAAYARRLDAALALLHAAEHATLAVRTRDVARVRALLPNTLDVRLGATVVRADLSAVRADLTQGRLATAAARLSALRAALAAPPTRLARPDPGREKRLDQILSQPPFTVQPSIWSTIGAFIQRLLSPIQAVLDALNRLLQSVFGSAAGPIETGIPIVAGLIVAAALIFAANRSFGNLVPQAEIGEEEIAAGRRLDAAGARARAAALATSGDYREAARYTFLSTLLALDEAGRLRIDTATGNRDVLRQARAVPRLAETLTPVVRGFELFWFGHVPVTSEDYERYRRLNERVLEVVY